MRKTDKEGIRDRKISRKIVVGAAKSYFVNAAQLRQFRTLAK